MSLNLHILFLGHDDNSNIFVKDHPIFSNGKKEFPGNVYKLSGTSEEIMSKLASSAACVLAHMEYPNDSEKMKTRIKELLNNE